MTLSKAPLPLNDFWGHKFTWLKVLAGAVFVAGVIFLYESGSEWQLVLAGAAAIAIVMLTEQAESSLQSIYKEYVYQFRVSIDLEREIRDQKERNEQLREIVSYLKSQQK